MYVHVVVGNNKIPDQISLAIGDAIHNIRTALDHMTWEVVGLDKGTQDRHLKLPTGDNRVNFEASCQGIKTRKQEIRDMFKALEIFPGGAGGQIYLINQLDNADKHTVLRPAIRATTINKYRIVYPDGMVMAEIKDITLIGGDGHQMGLARVGPNLSIELDNDTKATPDIFFQDIEGIHAHRVIPTLRHYSKSVLETLGAIEKRCTAIWKK